MHDEVWGMVHGVSMIVYGGCSGAAIVGSDHLRGAESKSSLQRFRFPKPSLIPHTPYYIFHNLSSINNNTKNINNTNNSNINNNINNINNSNNYPT